MPRTNSDISEINLKINSMDHNTSVWGFLLACFKLNTNIEEKRTRVENKGKDTAGKESRERKLKKREYQNALQITT